MGPLLQYTLLFLLAGQVASQSCPVTDPKCYCDNKFNSYYSIVCKGLTSAAIPRFNPSSTVYNELRIGDQSRISEIQDNAFYNVKVSSLMLAKVGIRTIRDGAFRGLENTLTHLFLDGNELSSVPSRALRGLNQLRHLVLSSNKITRIEADAFSGLPNLRYVFLLGNNIDYVSPDAFRGLYELRVLSLANNQIRSLEPRTFGDLRNLQELVLRQNRLTDMDPALFQRLGKLTRLDLSENQLISIRTDMFNSLNQLVYLSLGKNTINDLTSGTFNGMPALKSLNLYGNRLRYLRTGVFDRLSNLEALYLHDNQIDNIPSNVFRSLSMLKQLHLQSNQLTRVNLDMFNGLTNVWDLDLGNNRISNLDNSPFQRLTNLQQLNLQGNMLNIFYNSYLGGLNKLTVLRLDNNSLTAVRRDSFGSLPSLVTLTLGGNRIRDIYQGSFNGLTNLRSLELHNNSINQLQDGLFTNNKELKSLKLSNNQISRYTYLTWQGLGQLYYLHLDGNQIQSLPAEQLNPLTMLTHLNLQRNSITRVELRSFHKLRNLLLIDLCQNQVNSVDDYAFDYQRKMKELRLCNNRLSRLNVYSLKSLHGLVTVDLSYNQFRSLTKAPFEQELTSLKSVFLEGNPLVCDCNIIWMRTFAPTVSGMAEKTAVCDRSGPHGSQRVICYPLSGCPSVTPINEAATYCQGSQTTPTPPTRDFPTASVPFECSIDRDFCQLTQVGGPSGTNYYSDVRDNFDWMRGVGNTPTPNTGPNGDHTTGRGYYAYISAAGKGQGSMATMLLGVNVDRQSCLSFYYSMYGRNIGSLNIRIKTTGAPISVWRKGGAPSSSSTWYYGQVTLNPGEQVILFDGVVGNGPEGDIAVDDVKITSGGCPAESGGCPGMTCRNGGSCERTEIYDKCRCPSGTSGLYCQTTTDQCRNNPCQNGGRCMSSVTTGFRCECPPTHRGIYCESRVDPCSNDPCQNGGTCVSSGTTYSCRCTSDFTGPICNQFVNPCNTNPCQNGATCGRVDFQRYVCACLTGFTGTQCQTQIRDPCQNRPCQNGATCVPTSALSQGYGCLCPSGFSGPQCATRSTNPCSTAPCQNGGRCFSDASDYICDCTTGFGGRTCSQRLAACASNPCLNQGTCSEASGTFVCACASGFTGRHCQTATTLGALPMRLAGTGYQYQGRLEVLYNGEWGTVCRDNFNDMAARIVCSALGFRGGAVYSGPMTTNIQQRIWLDGVQCDYMYPSLQYCRHNEFGVHNCQHSQDVAVRCDYSGPPPQPTPPPPTARSLLQCDFETGFCLSQETGDDFDWDRRNTATPSGDTGPNRDHTTGTGYYVFIEASSPRSINQRAVLATPSFPVQNTKSCLKFWYHMYGGAIGQLSVVSYVGGSPTSLFSKSGNQGNNWLEGSADLPELTNRVTFTATMGSDYRGDIGLDDVTIVTGPCAGGPRVVPPTPAPAPTTTTRQPTQPPPVTPTELLRCDFEADSCPSHIRQDTSDQFDWSRKSGAPGSSGTGPTGAHDGMYYIYIESSSPRKKDERASLFIRTDQTSQDKCLVFWYHMFGSHIGSLEVNGYFTPGVSSPQRIHVLSGAQGNQWIRGSLGISSVYREIQIVGVIGGGYQGDIALDDIRLMEGNCQVQGARPTTIAPPATPRPTSPPASGLLWRCDFERGDCPYLSNTQTNDKFDWSRRSGNTPSSGTGPSAARNSPSGYYMYTEASSPRRAGDYALLLSQPITQVAPQMCLMFWFHMLGNEMGSFNVLTKGPNDAANQYKGVWSKTGNYGNQWHQAKVPIESPPRNFQIYMEGVVKEWSSDVAVDDVELYAQPCYDMTSPQQCDFETGDCFLHESRIGQIHWNRARSRTRSDTGPASGNNQAGSFLIMRSQDHSSGSKAVLETPLIAGGTVTCLRFYYHMYGNGIGSLAVTLTENQNSNLWSIRGNQRDVWHQASVEVYHSSNFHVLIVATVGGQGTGDIALDDVTLARGRC